MKLHLMVVGLLCLGLCAETADGQKRRRAVGPRTSRVARQTQVPAAPSMPVLPDLRSDSDVKDADVAIIANITAKELRFDVVPNPTVEFLGKDKTSTMWHADRYNLPDKVEPGVTYRNIGIRLKITSRLADIERIVAEALGELPVSNSSTPVIDKNISPPNQTTQLVKQATPVSSGASRVSHE